MKTKFIYSFLILLSCVTTSISQAQPRKMLLQGFWWDFRNNNYREGWANYLADMAPRLKQMGINSVWIPVSSKNANPFSVGYSPFDQYDLGDKFQKGRLKTTFGDKDEFLRMVAILHANGIEVVQDVVLNHTDQAGSSSSAGGQDPAALTFFRNNVPLSNFRDIANDPTNGFKTFRYVSHSTPVTDESADDYLRRNGRWPKNWQNFYPNPADNRFTGDDPTRITFGPDMAYNPESRGLATNATFNPPQARDYMRTEARNWMVWLIKQTGVDGWRLDAIKHFPNSVSEDMLFNTQFNAAFASRGNNMFAVGEWVGGRSEIDAWVDAVQDRAGTFDFGLRGFSGTPGLLGMVYGMGNYDLGNLPAQQQARRRRTVPFVNNHDTFRPPLLPNGDYPPNRWNSGSELAANIDPREPRLAAAYAVACAVDGSPQIFFEDLFNIGERGRRYTHMPTSDTSLPERDDISIIIRCHQKMGWKDVDYLVPFTSPNHLIIERRGRAIIGINDSFENWQGSWITTEFAPGTRLVDYGGSSGPSDVRVVAADRRVQISTPPCNGSARRRGFSIWAPEGLNINAPFNTAPIFTQQEWEMADDLGDSHRNSLQQGGAIPARSLAWRNAGKIYAEAGTTITYRAFHNLADSVQLVTAIGNECGVVIDSIVTRRDTPKEFVAQRTGWHTIKIRNGSDTVRNNRRAWVNVRYMAPQVVDTRANPSRLPLTIDLGPDRFLCATNTVFNPFVSNEVNHQWTLPNGTTVGRSLLNITEPGVYTFRAVNRVTGCQAVDSFRVLGITPAVQNRTILRRTNDTLWVNPQANVRYMWSRNGIDLPNETNNFLIASAVGAYRVRVISTLECGEVSASIIITNTLPIINANEIQVYPNPANDLVKVELPEMYSNAEISIINTNGAVVSKQMMDGTNASLNISNLAKGMYIIKISHNLGNGTTKLIVR